jgi:hypothetical protein
MPKSADVKRKLVLNRETVRALTNSRGTAFITTKGPPSAVYTYCELECDYTQYQCGGTDYC